VKLRRPLADQQHWIFRVCYDSAADEGFPVARYSYLGLEVDLVDEDYHKKHIFDLSMLPRLGAYALLFFDENNEKAFVAIVGILNSEPWAYVIISCKKYTKLQDFLVNECYDEEEYMRINPCDRVIGDLLF
jgi:hypothetical protein